MLGNLRHPWLWQVLGWLLVIGAITLSLLPSTQLPPINANDKVEHALTYCVLSLWFAGLYPRSSYIVIGGLLFFMGVGIEWAQGAMALGRQRDYLDVIANSVGIFVGLVLALFWLGDWVQRIERWTRRS